MCDRVWIADTLNYRIQIISSSGIFISEWKCFDDSLVYELDLQTELGLVLVTIQKSNQQSEILIIASQLSDCSHIEPCTIQRRLAIKPELELHRAVSTSVTMLHSVVMDSSTESLYLSALPGSFPPLKFSPGSLPPLNNRTKCPRQSSLMPKVWNATILLTPFVRSTLHTASVEYSDDRHAMHITLYGSNGLPIKEILNIKNQTYTLNRNSSGMICSKPHSIGWITPSRNWFTPYDCECKGSVNISAVETLAWSCSKYKIRDWYWTHINNGSIWRIFLNNMTNPTKLPVIGNYTMANFLSYGDEIESLNTAYEACIERPTKFVQFPEPVSQVIIGECPHAMPLPDWPIFFHMTATFIPVVLNNADLLPGQVVYDWEIESQHTTMCESSATYNAYLIKNKTFILKKYLDTDKVKCLSNLTFGPPKPNWMTTDKCECKGILAGHRIFPATAADIFIAVCPVAEDRVFWTWFTNDDEFIPLVFFETLTPADEGTGLAFADYHSIYQGVVLTDLNNFVVPSDCL